VLVTSCLTLAVMALCGIYMLRHELGADMADGPAITSIPPNSTAAIISNHRPNTPTSPTSSAATSGVVCNHRPCCYNDAWDDDDDSYTAESSC
jgi:hypothetical protein